MFEKFKTDADLQLLSEYRTLFKKEVPLSRRSWMAAYLLMLLDQGQGNTGRFDKNRDRERGGRNFEERNSSDAGTGNFRQENPRPEFPRSESPRRSLPEEESRRLFISIGRNRRVFPREILGLINSRIEISRDDIGAIRIMDNYSFVQVRDSVADDIIEALNGTLFRGRTLTVNYARMRKDGEDRNEDNFTTNDEVNGSAGDAIENTPEDRIEDEADIGAEDSLDQEDDQTDEEGV